ncbi:MAG: hypothetical protein PF590_06395 [Candidatus Delongbacteria bacterium]|nr:hypothetical protein [Candidatus Delongbacteria bacterium]
MKNITISVLFCLFITSNILSQNVVNQYSDVDVSVEYTTKDGKLHGQYLSYYPDGSKKAKGSFRNNQRTGMWKLWNESGKLIETRKYQNNLVYAYPNDDMEDVIPYQPQRNEEGLYSFYKITEQMAAFSKRTISVILPEDNPALFNGAPFLKLLKENQGDENFQAIEVYDDYSTKPLELPQQENMKIIGYKIMQEFVYDTVRMILEPRIVFIAPVILDVVNEGLYDNNWLSFESIYPAMASIEINIPGWQPEITTLADVFFWQAYTYRIVQADEFNSGFSEASISPEAFKEKTVMDKIIANSDNKRIQFIELEHDLWSRHHR